MHLNVFLFFQLSVTVSCFGIENNNSRIFKLDLYPRKLAPVAAATDHPLPVAPMKNPAFCSRVDARRERTVNVHVVGQLLALALRLFVNRLFAALHHGASVGWFSVISHKLTRALRKLVSSSFSLDVVTALALAFYRQSQTLHPHPCSKCQASFCT